MLNAPARCVTGPDHDNGDDGHHHGHQRRRRQHRLSAQCISDTAGRAISVDPA
jgi:hypothetical protein